MQTANDVVSPWVDQYVRLRSQDPNWTPGDMAYIPTSKAMLRLEDKIMGTMRLYIDNQIRSQAIYPATEWPDITSRALIEGLRALRHYDPVRFPNTSYTTLAMTYVLRAIRAPIGRRADPILEETTVHMDMDTKVDLTRAIQRLPEMPRQIVSMILQGLQEVEISALLGIHPHLVAQQYSVAKQQLRELLQGAPGAGYV